MSTQASTFESEVPSQAEKVEREFLIVCHALGVSPHQLLKTTDAELKGLISAFKEKVTQLATQIVSNDKNKMLDAQSGRFVVRQEAGENYFQNLCEAAQAVASASASAASQIRSARGSSNQHELTNDQRAILKYHSSNVKNVYETNSGMPSYTHTTISRQVRRHEQSLPESSLQFENQPDSSLRYNNNNRYLLSQTQPAIQLRNKAANRTTLEPRPNRCDPNSTYPVVNRCLNNQTELPNVAAQLPYTSGFSPRSLPSNQAASIDYRNKLSAQCLPCPKDENQTFEDILGDILRACANIRYYFGNADDISINENIPNGDLVILLNACETIQRKYGDVIETPKCETKQSIRNPREFKPVANSTKFPGAPAQVSRPLNSHMGHSNQTYTNYTVEDCEE